MLLWGGSAQRYHFLLIIRTAVQLSWIRVTSRSTAHHCLWRQTIQWSYFFCLYRINNKKILDILITQMTYRINNLRLNAYHNTFPTTIIRTDDVMILTTWIFTILQNIMIYYYIVLNNCKYLLLIHKGSRR